jgi:hypothetical protein
MGQNGLDAPERDLAQPAALTDMSPRVPHAVRCDSLTEVGGVSSFWSGRDVAGVAEVDANVSIIVWVLIGMRMPDSLVAWESRSCCVMARPQVVLCGSTITQCRRGRKARRAGIGGNLGELGMGISVLTCG